MIDNLVITDEKYILCAIAKVRQFKSVSWDRELMFYVLYVLFDNYVHTTFNL